MNYNRKALMTLLVFVAFGFAAFAQDAAVKNGIKMYHYQKYKSAQQALTPLASDALANYYLGLSYLDDGNVQQASTTFSKFPEDPANISGTARVAFAKKDVAGANKILKTLVDKARKKEWIQAKYAADAITYSTGGDYQQAAAWYKEVLTKMKDEDKTEVYIGLGDAMRHIPGGGGEAMTNYEMVTDKDKSNSLAFSRIGDLWYEARNYQSALDNYGRAKEADAANPLPYKALGYAYSRSGKYKLALQNLEEYLSHSDNTPEDQLEYCRALYLAQSYCDAAKKAEKLLQGQKDQDRVVELTGIMGFSQANCGDSMVALNTLRRYFAMQDQQKITPGAFLELGKLFMKLEMFDSAGFYYEKGIAGDTSSNKTDVYRDVADAFKGKKNYCMSAEWYTKMIDAYPDATPTDYVWRVIMYYYCKNFEGATKAAADFTTKYGADQPSAYYWQGRVAAAIDSEATTCAAAPFYRQWLDKVQWNDYEKKNDLKATYEYLLYCYWNSKDKEGLAMIKEKMAAIAPDHRALKQIEQLEKASGK